MNDSKKKATAKLPRGLVDYRPADIAAIDRMLREIKKSYELYGFEAVETPFIEYTEALGKFLPDQDRPNEGVFSFQDDDEQWLSLRYDLTAPLARYVAENFDRLPKPYRSYRLGPVFRNEKPGPGRYRQFMQFDADTVGASSVAADAEMCMMAADTLQALGVKRGDYVIKVNSRKLLDGVMDAARLAGEENKAKRLIVLRALDKYDRLGAYGVRALLGDGRTDESGDRTQGANLVPDQIAQVMTIFELSQQPEANSDHLPRWELEDSAFTSVSYDRALGGMVDEISSHFKPGALRISNLNTISLFRSWFSGCQKVDQALDELEEMAQLVRAVKYGSGRIRFDPSVVRGLEYYTGPVFEAELTFETAIEDGKPVRFGSVGGGGRYDGLIGRFRGEEVPATGFSIGVSRLYAALKAINSPIIGANAQRGPVIVLVLDQGEIARYQQFVSQLRNENVAAELYLGQSGMNAQLKYADKRGAICAIIQGSNERAKGEIAIRDLVLGAELAAASKDRADYLDLRAKAQFTVPETKLVEAVKEVLARHS
jgi:histidyl-tRNA synthetase